MTASSLPALDALILLGCRIGAAGPGGAAQRRAERAAAAFREIRPKCVIVSGGRRWHGVTEADALARALVALGVPNDAVIRELYSVSTVENAVYSAELARAGGFERLGVVTCDWHMRRALMCFDAAGLQPTPILASSSMTWVPRLKIRAGERVRHFIDRRVAAHWAMP